MKPKSLHVSSPKVELPSVWRPTVETEGHAQQRTGHTNALVHDLNLGQGGMQARRQRHQQSRKPESHKPVW